MTADPLSLTVPALASVVILTAVSALAPDVELASIGSVKPKSAALNTYDVSSVAVTVLFVPAGASFTAVIDVFRATVPTDQCCVPPTRPERSLLADATTVASDNRAVRTPGVPLKFVAGVKRSLSVVDSRTAVESDTEVETAVQVLPALMEYSHVPCAALAVLPTIATPPKLLTVLVPPETVAPGEVPFAWLSV